MQNDDNSILMLMAWDQNNPTVLKEFKHEQSMAQHGRLERRKRRSCID